MRSTVSETAKLSGVSVRTLHYYDQIGLLSPDEVDAQNGYRYYGAAALARLQEILFYRELDFPLKEIAALLRDPGHDRSEALRRQKTLLELKKARLERLIALVDQNLKGETDMTFAAFNNTDYEQVRAQYAQEAKERWGDTAECRQSEAKTASMDRGDWQSADREAGAIFARFAACRGQSPDSSEAQELVARWQAHITEHFYLCTNEILAGLGQMYTADERFRQNIDRHGEGTAQFMSDAIAAYCKK